MRGLLLTGNADARCMLGIAAFAFAVRLLYVLWFQPDPTGDATTDGYFYHHSAEAMTAGRGYIFAGRGPEPTAHWPPGYTAVLSAVYLLPGPNLAMGKLLNVALGAATCGLVFALGSVLWNRSIGIAAGGILTIFPSHTFYSALILTETLYTAMIAAILLLFALATRGRHVERWPVALGFGLLLGTAALIRGEGVLLALLLAAAVWYVTHNAAATARFGALAVAGTAIVVGCWTLRNAIQMDGFVPINTGSSVVLSLGHWEGADGRGNRVRSSVIQRYYPELDGPERDVKAHNKRTREAIDYWVSHPGHELRLIPQRIVELFRHDADAIEWAPQEGRTLSQATLDRLKVISNIYYFATIAAAVIGIVLWWRQNRLAVVVLGGLVVYLSAVIGLVFFGDQRYHAMLVPAFAVLAAPTLAAVWNWLRRFLSPLRASASG